MRALNRQMRKMAEKNEYELVTNLDKRTIEFSKREQLEKYVARRLLQFKVNFIMSIDFDKDDLFKFIKNIKGIIQKFEKKKKDLSKHMTPEEIKSTVISHNKKLLNIDYIYQDPEQIISVEKISKKLKDLDPDFIHHAYEKMQIFDMSEFEFRSWKYDKDPNWFKNTAHLVSKFSQNLENGTKNSKFRPIVDFVEIYSDFYAIVDSIPKINSKVIAMWVYDYFKDKDQREIRGVIEILTLRRASTVVNRRQYEDQEENQSLIAQGIRNNEALQKYLQYLEMRNSLSQNFIDSMFEDLTVAPMENLREFVTLVRKLEEFENLMNLFKFDKIDIFKTNFPKLESFGISFGNDAFHSHINYKVLPNRDYVKVTAKNYIILYYYSGSETTVYKIHFADKCEIYASVLHNDDKPELATLNLIQYLSFKPILIEEMSQEEFKTCLLLKGIAPYLQYLFGYTTPTFEHGGYPYHSNGKYVGGQIQMEVEFENITHIEVRRMSRLHLKRSLETAIDAKSQNPKIDFILTLNTRDISDHTNVNDLIELFSKKKDIVDEFHLVNLRDEGIMRLIKEILVSNKKLRKFTYPDTIQRKDLDTFEKICKTIKNCRIVKSAQKLDLKISY